MRLLEFDLGINQNAQLNPKLWKDNDLLPDVKSALIKIAEDFKKYIDIPFEVEDVTITGGQVSYYYTDHSDLDLHLIVDFDSVDCDREAAELFDTKRLLYKNRYTITVNGIPVELYVEDKNFPAVSASYSILQDTWLVKPKRAADQIDLEEVERMTDRWHRVIGAVLASNDIETAKKTMEMLRNYRKIGLKKTGEYGVANIVYKTLRNSKIVEKLQNFIDDQHQRQLSIGQ
jgi:hypothetical protein